MMLVSSGGTFAPKSFQLVWYKGQRYVYAHDSKQDPPKLVSGQYSTLLCFALMVGRCNWEIILMFLSEDTNISLEHEGKVNCSCF